MISSTTQQTGKNAWRVLWGSNKMRRVNVSSISICLYVLFKRKKNWIEGDVDHCEQWNLKCLHYLHSWKSSWAFEDIYNATFCHTGRQYHRFFSNILVIYQNQRKTYREVGEYELLKKGVYKNEYLNMARTLGLSLESTRILIFNIYRSHWTYIRFLL